MTYSFRPAKDFKERHGVFVSLTGGTNAGKTFSALRLARGIAGPKGKVAVIDTEGGRTLHLKDQFDFDAMLLDPPFRPHIFSEAAKAAEDAGYDALLTDSFSMEWTGIGGVLAWQEEELVSIVERAKQRSDRRSEYQIREAGKMAAWIKPKMAHKAMVYSLLQRRIPIIFAIRGEESVKPGEGKGDKPTKVFKSICSPTFPFEVTVSFRLDSERKGYIDLSDPKSWKMESAHQAIFRDGERISEEHGVALARWACGERDQGDAVKDAPSKPARTWATVLAEIDADFMAATNRDRVDEILSSDVVKKALDKADGGVRDKLNAIVQSALARHPGAPEDAIMPDDDTFPGDRP